MGPSARSRSEPFILESRATHKIPTNAGLVFRGSHMQNLKTPLSSKKGIWVGWELKRQPREWGGGGGAHAKTVDSPVLPLRLAPPLLPLDPPVLLAETLSPPVTQNRLEYTTRRKRHGDLPRFRAGSSEDSEPVYRKFQSRSMQRSARFRAGLSEEPEPVYQKRDRF